MSIPLIDLSDFVTSAQANQTAIAKQIYQACHEIGFMYIQNKVISTAQLEQVFCQSKSFFTLPLSVKQELAWSDEFSNTGYVGLERESLNPHQPGDLKEAFNITNPKLASSSPSSPSLANNPVILSFYDKCTELANIVLQAFAIALKLPQDFFTSRHNQQNHTLRSLHYPPLQTFPKPGQIRAGEHSELWQYYQETGSKAPCF